MRYKFGGKNKNFSRGMDRGNVQGIGPYKLRAPIKAIYAEVPDILGGKCRQNIRIEYDGAGFIPLDDAKALENRRFQALF